MRARAAAIPPAGAETAAEATFDAEQPRTEVVGARGLTRAFGTRRALRPTTLSIASGERVAILGANGAGKSTLIRLLATLLRPTSGALQICGYDAATEAQEARRLIGVVLHETLLYPDLTVRENLDFYARLYAARLPQRRDDVCRRFGLLGLEDRRLRQLSRGQQQRTALARAFLHDPPLLLLDEPDTGLDAAAFELLRDELQRDPGRTVVLTTHHAGHALDLATRLLLLENGRATDLGPANLWPAADLQRAVLRQG